MAATGEVDDCSFAGCFTTLEPLKAYLADWSAGAYFRPVIPDLMW